MSKTVIKAENLSKAYQLGDFGTGTISRDLERYWMRLRGKEDPFLKIGETNDRSTKGESDVVWSLKDINFEIEQGDAVGIIGRNGAGKSTLLKILSRVTAPTAGTVKMKGRIASLLEVGTGFHPELTGRENIYLNGAILGMRKAEIKRKFDEIVDFSGVERYVDTPVKRYSSGMYVRLAFAVAAYLESEILIVDEVLAVGDAEFQKKCLGKMSEVSRGEGRTVLFVSHNMSSVRQLCTKGMILDKGEKSFLGGIAEVIDRYHSLSDILATDWQQSGSAQIITQAAIDINKDSGGLKLVIRFSVAGQDDLDMAFVAFDIKNSTGVTIMQAIPESTPFIDFSIGNQQFASEIDIYGLIPDTYSVSIWLGPHYTDTYEWLTDILQFEVVETPVVGRTVPHTKANGFFVPNSVVKKVNETNS